MIIQGFSSTRYYPTLLNPFVIEEDKMKFIKILMSIFFMVQLLAPSVVICGDLDDGISTYTEDSIQKYDDLGKKDRNVTFIKMNARSKANSQSNANTKSGSSSESANMNSVVMGAGSTVKGDIIIIDDSKGDKTLVAD